MQLKFNQKNSLPLKGWEILDTCIGSPNAGQFTKNINHGGYMKLILTVFIFFVLCSGARAESVVDFIIANNPELQELRAINRNILKSLKVEAKSGLSYGRLAQEGTSTLERAQARYDIGISASLPLISPSEKAVRRIEEARMERTIRIDVSTIIQLYKTENKAIEEELGILQNLYNELQWIGKRVQAGVDFQKDYNARLNDYLVKRKDHEIRKEQAEYLIEKVLAYVPESRRAKLKEMLNGRDIPKN